MLRPLILFITIAAIPLSFVNAPYPDELVLQHVPTVFGILMLSVFIRTAKLSGVSFACAIISAFVVHRWTPSQS